MLRTVKKDAKITSTAKDVDAYIAALPPDAMAALAKLRKQIKAAAPRASEGLFYGMPAFKQLKWLVCYAAFKAHYSFFPMSTSVLKMFRSELKLYQTSKGTIRFPYGRPFPASLVKKIVKARIAEVEALQASKSAKPR